MGRDSAISAFSSTKRQSACHLLPHCWPLSLFSIYPDWVTAVASLSPSRSLYLSHSARCLLSAAAAAVRSECFCFRHLLLLLNCQLSCPPLSLRCGTLIVVMPRLRTVSRFRPHSYCKRYLKKLTISHHRYIVLQYIVAVRMSTNPIFNMYPKRHMCRIRCRDPICSINRYSCSKTRYRQVQRWYNSRFV